MTVQHYTIISGDYDRAGLASRELKAQLKQIGVEAGVVRRATIAAYEAEMNVVIHASKGRMTVSLADDRVDVRVEDEGPGIPDVEQAMVEGFSTAPPEARELGFGAGMGLPNIKRHSDELTVQSEVGRGTLVVFSVLFQPQRMAEVQPHSVQVAPRLCQGCLRCLFACRFQAIRVRDLRPEIKAHLCIDCPVCVDVCPTDALTVAATSELPEPPGNTTLVLPTGFLAQFGSDATPDRVLDVLREMGFADIRVTDAWERALRCAAERDASEGNTPKPVIPPMCPAIVGLVETRFPSLIAHLAPFVSPVEAVQQDLAGRHGVFVTLCPCQRTVLRPNGLLAKCDVIVPSVLINAVRQRIGESPASERCADRLASGPAPSDGVLMVSGVDHCLSVLDRLENGLVTGVDVLELYLCDQGCFGSSLLPEDGFIARHRWQQTRVEADAAARALRRRAPFSARAGQRLDSEMAAAIRKLGQIDELARSLPGRDCAMCGAPSCRSLAEDIIRGEAQEDACVHLSQEKKS